MPFRYLNHRPTRYTTRMLGGVRRPHPPNYIAIACRALEEVLRIDNRLRPYMAEQKRMLEHYAWMKECEAAICRVYGPVPAYARPRPFIFTPAPVSPAQVLKQEEALAKSQYVLARLKAKLRRR